MIDIEEKLQSLDLENRPNHDLIVEFEHSCEKRNIVLLRISLLSRDLQTHTTTMFIIIDLETKEIGAQQCSPFRSVLMEINMSYRLQAMKVLS
jgi:hypothetical protein